MEEVIRIMKDDKTKLMLLAWRIKTLEMREDKNTEDIEELKERYMKKKAEIAEKKKAIEEYITMIDDENEIMRLRLVCLGI